MNRTFTPTLSPSVLPRLEAYAELFRDDFPLARQADWPLVYLRGLLQDGERKSIEPLVARVDLPPLLRVKNPDQCLQNFVNQADWDEQAVWRRYRCRMAATFADPEAVFVIDDTTFPKKGKHSVGVQRQYCGAMGKKANCQCAVSVHYAAPKGHYPLATRLYLPESWLGDAERLDKAGVPSSCDGRSKNVAPVGAKPERPRLSSYFRDSSTSMPSSAGRAFVPRRRLCASWSR